MQQGKTDKYSYFQAFQWIYSRLLNFQRKHFWLLFGLMVITGLLETVALGAITFFASAVTDPGAVLTSKYVAFIRQIFTENIFNSRKNLIILSGSLMLILIIIKNILKGIVTYWTVKFSINIEIYFGEKLLKGFLALPYKWHLNSNSADLVYAIEWRRFIGRQFIKPSLIVFNSTLLVSIMLISLLVVQPVISLMVIGVIGTTATFVYKTIRKKIDRVSSIARNYELDINKEATMAIHGVKDVKISLQSNYFISKFLKKAKPLGKMLGIIGYYSQSPVLILETVGFAMICLAIFSMVLFFKTTTAYMTGTMTILAVTAWKALPAANDILGSITKIRGSLPYISNYVKYFALIEADDIHQSSFSNQSSELDAPDVEHKNPFKNSIEFQNVSFSYGETHRNEINSLSFIIEKGETIGIVGSSGAGKSTLVDLLISLLEPDHGSIIVDGERQTGCRKKKWLKTIGYVPQSPYIYDGTLAENIAFGIDHQNIDRTQVKKCCTMASMDDFVYDLPNGIDSLIGERGVKLSGGQKQRVAIARALYRNPQILIFDEATSSLDTKSEKAIQKTIYSFKGRQTLIIIAHRLSTVEECDKIIWLERGEIVMSGQAGVIIAQYKRFMEEKHSGRELH